MCLPPRRAALLLLLLGMCGLPGPLARGGLAAQSMVCHREAQAAAIETGSGSARARVAELRRAAAVATGRRQALFFCLIAEEVRRQGDPAAARYYRMAIVADPDHAEYHWLFGDYLRTFRGARQPLFGAALAQYRAALRSIPPDGRSCPHSELACHLHRSLIALYERDGVPLAGRIGQGAGPVAFASTGASLERRTADIGEFDDVRDFTSEALFAASRDRLARPLTAQELERVARNKREFEVTSRIRLRLGRLPTVDLLYQHRGVGNAQITSFYEPGRTNRFELDGFGAALEAPLDAYPVADLDVRAEVRRSRRMGLIEFQPGARERVTSVAVRAAAARFVGAHRVSAELAWARDWIDQRVSEPLARHIELVAPTLRFERFHGAPFERRIAPRGSEVYAGAALVREAFGAVDVRRRDFFGGVALRGIHGLAEGQSFDATLQPTLFAADRTVPGEPLRHAQLRTFGTLLYRVRDYENESDARRLPTLVSLNLLLAGSRDFTVRGPGYFQSQVVGAGLDARLVVRGLGGGTTVLGSARYDLQQYRRLDRSFGSFSVNLGVGF